MAKQNNLKPLHRNKMSEITVNTTKNLQPLKQATTKTPQEQEIYDILLFCLVTLISTVSFQCFHFSLVTRF